MKENPAGDWRALTERYRSMIDEELSELAADFDDLTPMAQQALRDEMRLRKLGDPQSPHRMDTVHAGVRQRTGRTSPAARFGFSLVSRVPELIPDEPADVPEGEWVEYTWKTPLCRCASGEQAWQISEVLRRAGIESWIEGAGTYASSSGSQDTAIDDGTRRVVVAADQLD